MVYLERRSGPCKSGPDRPPQACRLLRLRCRSGRCSGLRRAEASVVRSPGATAVPARDPHSGEDPLLGVEAQVIRTGELQAWFVAEHLVDTPLVRT